jgi:hypothetical protein
MARKDEAEFWMVTITLVVIVIGVLGVLARLSASSEPSGLTQLAVQLCGSPPFEVASARASGVIESQ